LFPLQSFHVWILPKASGYAEAESNEVPEVKPLDAFQVSVGLVFWYCVIKAGHFSVGYQ